MILFKLLATKVLRNNSNKIFNNRINKIIKNLFRVKNSKIQNLKF